MPPYSYERHPLEYSYERLSIVANADEDLIRFERGVDVLERQGREIAAKVGSDPYALKRLSSLLQSAYPLLQRVGGASLFLDIVREYAMPPEDRKVMEQAAKAFSKSRTVKVKPEKVLETFEARIYEYRTYIQTARDVLMKGEKHKGQYSTTETTLQAGSFLLINTGGFPDAVMQECAKVAEKAEQLLRKKGLGKVCYGDVHVTNTVYRSTLVLAFYDPTDDNMYIRANLKGKLGPAVESVVHELGHRLDNKFLRGKQREIKDIYRHLSNRQGEADHALVMDRSLWPKAGDLYVEKGQTYEVERIDISNRGGLNVIVHQKDDPTAKARISLLGYIQNHRGVEPASAFVSHYASTKPEENFAEMIRAYCLDTLPQDQVEMLETIL